MGSEMCIRDRLGSFRGQFGDHFRVGDHFGGCTAISAKFPGVSKRPIVPGVIDLLKSDRVHLEFMGNASCYIITYFAVEGHSPPHELQNILGNLSELVTQAKKKV